MTQPNAGLKIAIAGQSSCYTSLKKVIRHCPKRATAAAGIGWLPFAGPVGH